MAKQSQVKCPYCGQTFYREDVEFEVIGGRRYAHKECYETDKKIHEFMKHVLGVSYLETKIEKQIRNMVIKDGISITGILNCLIYWYEIKQSSAEQANGGIGIVPYVYAEYLTYQKNQYENSQLNKGKTIQDYVGNEPVEIIAKPTPIRKPRHIKFYELH